MECEAKRAGSHAAALKEGKPEDQARGIAHEEAKRHWNAWAKDTLAKQKALKESGAWAVEEQIGTLGPQNAKTRAWVTMPT